MVTDWPYGDASFLLLLEMAGADEVDFDLGDFVQGV